MFGIGKVVIFLCCLVPVILLMILIYFLTDLHPVVLVSTPILNITVDPMGDDTVTGAAVIN